MSRRRLLTAAGGVALLSACAVRRVDAPGAVAVDAHPPIVFVHGNGDSSALWLTTLWRWESNGWPRDRLFAVDLPDPLSRDDDAVAQPGRSSAAEQRARLVAEVERVLSSTGAAKVVLVGSSRGGIAIRDAIARGGLAPRVSHAMLGGTPNHGVWRDAGWRTGSEFNGAGPVLTALNAPRAGGAEVEAGIAWLTLRSDRFDKFAQPDGVWIGARGRATNVDADGPALAGATNLVLPGLDHREVAFHRDAFAAMHRFVTGRAPAHLDPVPEPRVVLDGRVTGVGPAGATNRPEPQARVAVHAVDAATGVRRAVLRADGPVGGDGYWGPLAVDAGTALEFVLAVPGRPTLHVYRAPFARSSSVVHLRADVAPEPAGSTAAAVVVATRPRGYFGTERGDRIVLAGRPAPGLPAGVPGVASSRLVLATRTDEPVALEFVAGAGGAAERVVGRLWPAAEGRVTVLELHG